MTSNDVAAGLLDQLNYLGGESGAIVPPAGFTFDLDFDSARAWPDLPYDTASPLSQYALEARLEIVQILEAAASLFRRRAPKAWIFIHRELDSAMFRRSSAVDGASSSSNRQLVGTCLLTNLHLSPDPVLICVEALVHEAIHQHLYRIELANGPFCDLDDAGRYRSPWSGNRIPLHSLIHASLVWFGVLSLWCQLAKSCTSEDEALSVRGRVAPTLFGFAFIRQIVDGPTFPRASVAPQIVELISHIAKIATAAEPPPDGRGALGDFLQMSEKGEWVARLVSGLERVERSWQ